MGQKDIAEKTLEAYNDVFADIVNVLLFNGKNKVSENDLEDAPSESALKIDGKLHSQQRDVAKYWKNCNIRISLYGFENQTAIDKTMPLRVIAYDGNAYKQQLLDNQSEEKTERQKKADPFFPVVTLILYFGKKHWNKPRKLFDIIKVPEDLEPFVKDYEINIFEIAYLTDNQVKMFKSDFRIVADYFVQMRKNKKYVPSPQEMKHVEEVLQLLKILSNDDAFEINTEIFEKKGKPKNMEKWLHDALDNSKKEGKKEGKLETFVQLVSDGILTLQQAAARMGMSVAKFKKAMAELATNS